MNVFIKKSLLRACVFLHRQLMKPLNTVCPISFIPVDEIAHRVVFASEERVVVYSGEDVIEWLKHYSLVVPVTNRRIRADLAHKILKPFDVGDRATADLLLRAGFLDGRRCSCCWWWWWMVGLADMCTALLTVRILLSCFRVYFSLIYSTDDWDLDCDYLSLLSGRRVFDFLRRV